MYDVFQELHLQENYAKINSLIAELIPFLNEGKELRISTRDFVSCYKY